ncbi:hypothetical protein KY290_007982 [Solanum tuberosum]|uniref:Uncharacterized protein n=1 Tax=Solanum tuberosum TaxID=4113 RepID=A0ABQ7W731_SOLTU|nr:hypothetical protein KY290_007982 [Solanum tuberosum]
MVRKANKNAKERKKELKCASSKLSARAVVVHSSVQQRARADTLKQLLPLHVPVARLGFQRRARTARWCEIIKGRVFLEF